MPIKPKVITIALQTPDPDGICQSQTPAGAGNLTINGAQSSGGAVTFNAAYRVEVSSAGNVSTNTFTFTGTDQHGNPLTEAIAGPNIGTTTTTGYFKTVTQVAINAAAGAAVTVGSADEAVTQTVPVDIYASQTTFGADIGGTIDFTVQQAYERPTAGEAPNWINTANVSGKTADTYDTLNAQIGALRAVVNSYTAGAAISFRISQAAYR